MARDTRMEGRKGDCRRPPFVWGLLNALHQGCHIWQRGEAALRFCRTSIKTCLGYCIPSKVHTCAWHVTIERSTFLLGEWSVFVINVPPSRSVRFSDWNAAACVYAPSLHTETLASFSFSACTIYPASAACAPPLLLDPLAFGSPATHRETF